MHPLLAVGLANAFSPTAPPLPAVVLSSAALTRPGRPGTWSPRLMSARS